MGKVYKATQLVARQAGGAQGAAPGAAGRRAHGGPLPARGEGGQPAQPPQLHHGARLRPGRRRRPLHRDGVRGGQGPAPHSLARVAAARAARGAHRRPGALGALRRARRGRHSPRPQAREHHGRAAPRRARLRQGARLRHRQDHRLGRRRARAHPRRLRLRHARVHVARAGARRAARPPQRPLRGGRDPLPAHHRAAALRLRLGGRLRHQAPHRAAAAALQAPARGEDLGRDGAADHEGARQEPQRPPADRPSSFAPSCSRSTRKGAPRRRCGAARRRRSAR